VGGKLLLEQLSFHAGVNWWTDVDWWE